MNKLYLLLGGNLGDKAKIFANALELINQRVGEVLERSSVYETEPWGFESDDFFWNQAILVETTLNPTDCLNTIQQIEKEVGRVRKDQQYVSRIIDIDILFYNDLVRDTELLEIPHPRMIDRNFVLIPMNEIAPDLIHPVFQKTISELMKDCNDDLKVEEA